jgi:signal transduction histidine kinase
VKEAITTIKIPENIKISNQAKTEPWIKVDIRKMQRVFINIIKNAADAMPNGGKLTIETNTSKHSLQIAFTDTGLGMSKEIQKKLWSPFFTTKAKGMGLGLAICKRIVEAHKGKISLKSNVGKGTKFMIIVPLELEPEKGGENVWVNLPESLLSTMMKA